MTTKPPPKPSLLGMLAPKGRATPADGAPQRTAEPPPYPPASAPSVSAATPSPQQKAPAPEDKARVTVRVPRKFQKQFTLWCKANDIPQHDAVMLGFQLLQQHEHDLDELRNRLPKP